MIAVLIDSRRPGCSAWIAVRSTRAIHVKGMQEEDLLSVDMVPRDEKDVNEVTITEDGILMLREGTTRVKVNHVSASGNPIFVDLMR